MQVALTVPNQVPVPSLRDILALIWHCFHEKKRFFCRFNDFIIRSRPVGQNFSVKIIVEHSSAFDCGVQSKTDKKP